MISPSSPHSERKNGVTKANNHRFNTDTDFCNFSQMSSWYIQVSYKQVIDVEIAIGGSKNQWREWRLERLLNYEDQTSLEIIQITSLGVKQIETYHMSHISRRHLLLILVCCCVYAQSFTLKSISCSKRFSDSKIWMATFDEVNSASSMNKQIVVGFTTDAWNIGMRKYKDFLAVNKMEWKIQKLNIQCVEVRSWMNFYGPRNLCNWSSHLLPFHLTTSMLWQLCNLGLSAPYVVCAIHWFDFSFSIPEEIVHSICHIFILSFSLLTVDVSQLYSLTMIVDAISTITHISS